MAVLDRFTASDVSETGQDETPFRLAHEPTESRHLICTVTDAVSEVVRG